MLMLGGICVGSFGYFILEHLTVVGILVIVCGVALSLVSTPYLWRAGLEGNKRVTRREQKQREIEKQQREKAKEEWSKKSLWQKARMYAFWASLIALAATGAYLKELQKESETEKRVNEIIEKGIKDAGGKDAYDKKMKELEDRLLNK